MSRLRDIRVNPDDQKAIAEALTEVIGVVDSSIEFGNPQDPRSPSTTLAGSGTPTAHNGTMMNIKGHWVELAFTAADTEVVASHNLDVAVFNSEVNVRWIVMGMRHDGNTADAASTVSVVREDGGTLTANTIGLRAYVGGTRVVDADHPLRVSLFFIRANRWPA